MQDGAVFVTTAPDRNARTTILSEFWHNACLYGGGIFKYEKASALRELSRFSELIHR